MKNNVIGMLIVTFILAIVGTIREGPEIIIEGLLAGGKMLIGVIPLLIAAFLLAGFIQVLISKETIKKWLGQDAGFKGVLLGAVAGGLMPGGPYAYYPIAATFLLSGAEIGTVLAFVTSKNLWTLSRIPMEVALIGPRITLIRYVVTFIFPLIIGLAANIFFKSWGKGIREQAKNLQTAGEKE